ncbi:uncharacterized protein LOC108666526 [Hyalella azteca]|uniref:Uncharacterized protein LOC108666526 n=1 Tax=Hyalella azteca TaxID=294128 RepID=A0A8B7N5N5_HYAAZ|nr:uncharacterized protein LOC108666526 [Hyalella azteca]
MSSSNSAPRKRRRVMTKQVLVKNPKNAMNTVFTDGKSIKPTSKSPCSRCNSRRKCFRHLNQRFTKNIACFSFKASEQTVLQLKRHMLKLLSGDPGAVCRCDQRTGILTLDCTKMHRLYLQEFEPQAINMATGEMNSNYKPLVKQWLYRKILLDEFQGVDFLRCKEHLAELKLSLEESTLSKVFPPAINKKKKTKSKSQKQVATNPLQGMAEESFCASQNLPIQQQLCAPQILSHQMCVRQSPIHAQVCGDQSLNAQQAAGAGTAADEGLTHVRDKTVVAVQPFCHSSLGSTNSRPQQPLNLQRSQTHLQHRVPDNSCNTNISDHPAHNSLALPLCQSISSCGSIPLGLHSPYYVSLSPMLPLHMSQASSAPHHHFHHHIAHHHSSYPPPPPPPVHHQQHFQQEVVQHPQPFMPAASASLVNNHALYHSPS